MALDFSSRQQWASTIQVALQGSHPMMSVSSMCWQVGTTLCRVIHKRSYWVASFPGHPQHFKPLALKYSLATY